MSRQSRPIPDILRDRLAVVGRIAARNAEHLRLLQIAGGFEIDRLREERDGEPPSDSEAAAEAAIAHSLDLLDALEAELDSLDRELADATNPREPD